MFMLNCFQCVSYIKLEMQSTLFSTAKETSTLKHYLYLVFMVLVSHLTKDNKAKTKQWNIEISVLKEAQISV